MTKAEKEAFLTRYGVTLAVLKASERLGKKKFCKKLAYGIIWARNLLLDFYKAKKGNRFEDFLQMRKAMRYLEKPAFNDERGLDEMIEGFCLEDDRG